MRTRIKICGLTRPEDVVAAQRLGVDAVGFVFYAKSARAVSIPQARELADAVGPFVARVGLFLNARPADVETVLAQVPLDLLQFHGAEDPADCAYFGRPYIKAIPMGMSGDWTAYAAGHAKAQAYLLDSHAPGQAGGTGVVFDWRQVSNLSRPLILAGGLTPHNVARAIRQVCPYGVDVSSGVEREKGIKDARLIAAFVAEVHRVDGESN